MRNRVFLTAEWRHLLVLNYEVDPDILAPYIPPGTELDFDASRCFVSIVAFRFERTRLLGMAAPFHTTFPEINLRFYVLRKTPEGTRRGVVFLRELVNRRAVAAIANWAYNEHYRVMPIQAKLTLESGQVAPDSRVAYEWRHERRSNCIAAKRSGEWRDLATDSHEAFIAEHYFGYGVARDGRTIEYRVAHPAWRVADVSNVEIAIDARNLYGETVAAVMATGPHSAFLLDGSPVTVFRPTCFRANDTETAAHENSECAAGGSRTLAEALTDS
jgi:uncharacterized protein YqjF (DUF2071 family)